MKKQISTIVTKLSLVAALAITPVSLYAASGNAAIEGSSESSSAFLEGANVEQQINRVNSGISMIRMNTVLLKEMPISGDSLWVDTVTQKMTPEVYKQIRNSDAVKNDSYLATAMLTNVILGRPAVDLTPLNARLYFQLSTLYKNKDLAPEDDPTKYDEYSIPSIYTLPDFTDMDTFTNFAKETYGKKVEKIDVEAAQFELYDNVELATISLTPRKYHTQLQEARLDYLKAVEEVATIKGNIKLNEEKLDDDKNVEHPDREKWQEEIEVLKAELTTAEENESQMQDQYSTLIEQATLEIESNIEDDFETVQVPLAQKISKLLDLVDNNAIGAGSMFTAATAHLVKNGFSTLPDEIQAITMAQAGSSLLGNQKMFLVDRLERMGKGALMAIPNIAVGTYYAFSQSFEAGTYQTIVNKVLEIHEANEEARLAQEEAQKETQEEIQATPQEDAS
jgi:hypothetical protein